MPEGRYSHQLQLKVTDKNNAEIQQTLNLCRIWDSVSDLWSLGCTAPNMRCPSPFSPEALDASLTCPLLQEILWMPLSAENHFSLCSQNGTIQCLPVTQRWVCSSFSWLVN